MVLRVIPNHTVVRITSWLLYRYVPTDTSAHAMEPVSRKRDRDWLSDVDDDEHYEDRKKEMRTQRRNTLQANMATRARDKTVRTLRTTYTDTSATTTLNCIPGEIWTVILRYAGTVAHARLCRTAKSVATRIVHRNATEIDVPWKTTVSRMTAYDRLASVTIRPCRSPMRYVPDLSWMATLHLANTITTLILEVPTKELPSMPNLSVLICMNADLVELIASNMTHLKTLIVKKQLTVPWTYALDHVDWNMPMLKVLQARNLPLGLLRLPPSILALHVKDLIVPDTEHHVIPYTSVKNLSVDFYRPKDNVGARFPNLVSLRLPGHLEDKPEWPLPPSLRVLQCHKVIPSATTHLPPLTCVLVNELPCIATAQQLQHVRFLVCTPQRHHTPNFLFVSTMPNLRHFGFGSRYRLTDITKCVVVDRLETVHIASTNADDAWLTTAFMLRNIQLFRHEDFQQSMVKMAWSMVGLCKYNKKFDIL